MKKQIGRETTQARAVTRYLRIAPRKVRVILGTIRRKPVGQAMITLERINRKAARLVSKTLKSALANAKKKELDEGRLFIRYVFADGGPTLKRFISRSMGRADTILKRTSHITVILEEGKTVRSTPHTSTDDAKGSAKAEKSNAKKKLAGAAS